MYVCLIEMTMAAKRSKRLFWLEFGITTTVWLLLLALPPLGWGIDWPMQYWIKTIIFALVLTAMYYTNSVYLVPKFLLTNKILQYSLIVVVVAAVILVGMRAIEHSLDLPRLIHEIIRPNEEYRPKGWWRFDFTGMLMIFLVLGSSTSILLIRKDQKDRLTREELEKEKVSTELSFLKAQINPHFFFNTLNSIYALTSLNVADAQKAIHKLSAMMRYVLYDSRKELCTLSQEIDFVSNYIELMKLRLPEKVDVKFTKPTESQHVLIAPMLLLPYIENAFKHGISSQHKSSIEIIIDLTGQKLGMKVTNTMFESTGLKLEGSGIGMQNTQRRLELIYPNHHEVKINEVDCQYIVDFQIDLIS